MANACLRSMLRLKSEIGFLKNFLYKRYGPVWSAFSIVTLPYLVSILFFGKPDIGPIIGGYIGAIFLCAAFSAIGVFASSVTKNQLTAFFVAFMICIVLTMIDAFLIFLPAPIVSLLQFISANEHFTSISRGIIDTRDLIYFISLTALFFCLTVKTQENDRK